MARRRALCPECGKPMRYNAQMNAWDLRPVRGGHGFWDAEMDSFEFEEGS